MKTIFKVAIVSGIAGLASGVAVSYATAAPPPKAAMQIAPGLVLPQMDPVRGKRLFVSKGCVVCHSINNVGGTDAPKLDASTMTLPMNPFEFSARMWRGAPAMIKMQMHELGYQIQFTGQDLADIIAFVHNAAVQKTFSAADIPPKIKKMMEEGEGDDNGEHGTMRGTGHHMMDARPK